MERLTKHDIIEDYPWETNTENGMYDISDPQHLADMIHRLEIIEDILGPTYDLSRLKELVEADMDGRLVVLPVVPGDSIYVISTVYSMKEGRSVQSIAKWEVSSIGGNKLTPLWIEYGCYRFRAYPEEFGKSVFLSREEAEKTLEVSHE